MERAHTTAPSPSPVAGSDGSHVAGVTDEKPAVKIGFSLNLARPAAAKSAAAVAAAAATAAAAAKRGAVVFNIEKQQTVEEKEYIKSITDMVLNRFADISLFSLAPTVCRSFATRLTDVVTRGGRGDSV
jgi:hypothetical protein